MNKDLCYSIIKHIFSNFGIIPSSFINWDKTQSLLDKRFVLPEKLSFVEIDNNSKEKIIDHNIYGCQMITANKKNITLLLGECDDGEYALLIQLEGSPAYGLYFEKNNSPLITTSINNDNWIVCNTFLQATLLAAVEQTRDLVVSWKLCQNYQPQHKLLLSFIEFYNNYYMEN